MCLLALHLLACCSMPCQGIAFDSWPLSRNCAAHCRRQICSPVLPSLRLLGRPWTAAHAVDVCSAITAYECTTWDAFLMTLLWSSLAQTPESSPHLLKLNRKSKAKTHNRLHGCLAQRAGVRKPCEYSKFNTAEWRTCCCTVVWPRLLLLRTLLRWRPAAHGAVGSSWEAVPPFLQLGYAG